MRMLDPSQSRVRAQKARSAIPAFCAVATALAGTAVFAGNMTISDSFIARGFEKGFASTNAVAVGVRVKPYDGVSGSEDFWLRATAVDHVVRVVAVGHEITLSGKGPERRMTITDMREVGDAETHIETAARPEPVLLLTCREGDLKTGREIRLRLEAGRIREVSIDLLVRAL